MITSAEREYAIQQLDRTGERLLGVLQGLSPDQLLYRPEPGRWSIAENVEHLLVVETRLVGTIEKLLLEPAELSKQCALTDAELVRRIATVQERMPAPAPTLPNSRWPAETLPGEFVATRRRTREFTSAATGDLRRHFRTHFMFGDLDCYQWLLLIGAHCNRHTLQSEAVKSSPTFPR
jgi:hypothetical protein